MRKIFGTFVIIISVLFTIALGIFAIFLITFVLAKSVTLLLAGAIFTGILAVVGTLWATGFCIIAAWTVLLFGVAIGKGIIDYA